MTEVGAVAEAILLPETKLIEGAGIKNILSF
jgi:hypothetical protein